MTTSDIVPDWRPGDLAPFFRALLDCVGTPVLFCDLDDRMVYMNLAAERHYARWGGRSILGRSVLDCHNNVSRDMIAEIKKRFAVEPDLEEVLITDSPKHRVYMRAVRENGVLIGYFERYEPPKGS
jgi:PAS domain-containing protein